MLDEKTIIDQITVLEDGQIQVRTATCILRDGKEISRTFHRHVVEPGTDLTAEDPRVKAIGEVVHTPVVIAARNTYLESLSEATDRVFEVGIENASLGDTASVIEKSRPKLLKSILSLLPRPK